MIGSQKNILICTILVISVFLSSCSDKYLTYARGYHISSPDGAPNYANLDFWAAHPYKKDPSDSLPEPLLTERMDSSVDVFFVHPTTYTEGGRKKPASATIDDDYLNAKTDYSSILYQASVFNGSCRVFAPRYRQAHISQFESKDSTRAKAAFELAYQDVKAAFQYYLENYNKGRPFIIAGHSQGSLHAGRLLHELIEGTVLQNRLVCAYLPGMPIKKNYFVQLTPCRDSLSTGCFVSWRTLRRNYSAKHFLAKETSPVWVTNPLSWTLDTTYASKSLNKGSVLYNFNKVYTGVNDAAVHGNVLWISRPRFPWGFLYLSKNYHPGDINLFYLNIREDVKRRIANFPQP